VQDEKYIKRCLELAAQGELYTAPNPMVGCVIVHNSKIVAEGCHERYGEAHAEVNAFKNLPVHIDASDCEVYINLEPCSHYGKTPPCADLIVNKKPKRVIIGMLDPHTKVAGRGLKKLLEAGLKVKVGVLEDECKTLNKKFIKAHTTERPYVTLKWAETQDGFMARASGDKQSAQISDIVNTPMVHKLRASHQAILVGAITVNTDNPKLDVRGVDGNNPIKVVLSKILSVDLTTEMLSTGNTLVYNTLESKKTENYELVKLDDDSLDAILADMHARDIHSVLVEGGSQVLSSFIDAKAWDEAVILKAATNWESGIKAPWVGIPSVKEEKIGNDTIKYFLPK
jgi:diaminohydroxyphosphoribosylaminopyrimidine deaminase/5-amino-6-(5-phosphoribosylamino)uracil reductase